MIHNKLKFTNTLLIISFIFFSSCKNEINIDNKWLIGIWEITTNNNNYYALQLFSNGDCKLNLYNNWLSGKYKVYNKSLEVYINIKGKDDVPIMFNINSNEKKIYTSNNTEMTLRQ